MLFSGCFQQLRSVLILQPVLRFFFLLPSDVILGMNKKRKFIYSGLFFVIMHFLNLADPSGRTILSRGSAAARLLGLWVQRPPTHVCLSLVSGVCCRSVTG